MAINPRTRHRRLVLPRSWPGVRYSLATDVRKRDRRQTSGSAATPSRRVADSRPSPSAGLDRGAASPVAPSALVDAVIETFTASWDRGEPVRAEDYVDSLPPIDAAELIYHEYCLAEAADLVPDPADYLRRFPDHSDFLGRLFSLHGALSVGTFGRLVGPDDLPETGNEIGPYRLLRELGRGAFARVFLAEQADLGDRLVVVKVSTRPSSEPTLLARARHANIVEILRYVDADDGALHLICMPFLGGATLGAVLDATHRCPRAARNRSFRSGRDFLAVLDRASAPEYEAVGVARPAREIVARLSAPRAMAWMIARLAEGLDHAERRGVTHGDIKPSNILITADATPMLFDFNLAVDWHEADAPQLGTDRGGTLAYMAPERLRAIAEPDRPAAAEPTPRRRQPDRHRADLYALGLVLLEALTGKPPATPDRPSGDLQSFASDLARLREVAVPRPVFGSRRVPPALRAILARCLAPDPSDRYARGGELAADLDRWRTDRPLAHAPEPTRSTWVRRVRSLRFLICAVALTGGVAAAASWFALKVLEGSRRDQALAKLTYTLDRTEGVFKTRKVGNWRSDWTEDPADLANRLLAHYNVGQDPNWRDHDDIRALPDRERGELEAWMLEQILRRAVAYADRPDSPKDWERGLSLLERELKRTPLAAFVQQRTILRERLGLGMAGEAEFTATGPGPRLVDRWLDAYLLGVLAEPLHARQALGFYGDSLAARPDFFWGHYRAAVVACRIDEYPLAIQSLRECVARQPNNEMLRNLLASTMYTLGRHAVPGSSLVNLGEAQAECDRALTLNPDFTPAMRTRTRINQMLGQADSVRDDLERFTLLTRSSQPAESVLLRIDTRSLPGETFQPYTGAEEASLRRAIAADARNEIVKADLAHGLTLDGRGAEAVELYEGAIENAPAHIEVRLQHAIELARTGRPEAHSELTALVDHPRFEEVYRDRPGAFRVFSQLSRDLLDQGRLGAAEDMVRRGWAAIHLSNALRDEAVAARNLGWPVIYPRGEMHYAAARVAAVAGRTDPGRLPSAIAHLKAAFAERPAWRDEWFPIDHFFDAHRAEILRRIDGQ